MKKDNRLFSYVYEELLYYQKEWKHDMSDASIRRGSASLRSLLLENKLQLAWKYAGFEKQPKILAPFLDEYIRNLQIGEIDFIQAGGAISNAVQIAAVLQLSRILSEEERKRIYNKGPFKLKAMKFSDFVNSECIIVKGTAITRIEIVKYVSNKRGGAHLDSKRDQTKKLEKKYTLLDGISKIIKVTDRDPVMFELLSTVHYMQNSHDIHKLRKRLKKLS